jgi:hypothetical protein
MSSAYARPGTACGGTARGHAECGVALGDLAEPLDRHPRPGDARLERHERAGDSRTPAACAVSPPRYSGTDTPGAFNNHLLLNPTCLTCIIACNTISAFSDEPGGDDQMRRMSPQTARARSGAEKRLEGPPSRPSMTRLAGVALCVAVTLTAAACSSSKGGAPGTGTAANGSSYPLVYIGDESNTGGQATPALNAFKAAVAAANAHGGGMSPTMLLLSWMIPARKIRCSRTSKPPISRRSTMAVFPLPGPARCPSSSMLIS